MLASQRVDWRVAAGAGNGALGSLRREIGVAGKCRGEHAVPPTNINSQHDRPRRDLLRIATFGLAPRMRPSPRPIEFVWVVKRARQLWWPSDDAIFQLRRYKRLCDDRSLPCQR
jgi:hypothetical protein